MVSTCIVWKFASKQDPTGWTFTTIFQFYIDGQTPKVFGPYGTMKICQNPKWWMQPLWLTIGGFPKAWKWNPQQSQCPSLEMKDESKNMRYYEMNLMMSLIRLKVSLDWKCFLTFLVFWLEPADADEKHHCSGTAELFLLLYSACAVTLFHFFQQKLSLEKENTRSISSYGTVAPEVRNHSLSQLKILKFGA